MPVVFPPFDTSVDTRDLHKFRFLKVCAVHGRDSTTRIKDSTGIWRHVHTGCELKGANCKLAGYHISSVGLFKLLTAVEVIGYWKHDGQLLRDSDGEPLLNHAAIVDYDDWQHAFSRLSPVNLDGTENKNRIPTRNTWTAATSRGKDRESTALLQGIITSPLGTVQCNGGKYKVTEQREGMPSRSITLHIGTCTVDQFFVARLEQRSIETDLTDDLWNELVGVRAKNQKALVSVDEQIARYEQSIEGTQAVLKALGKGVDKETAILYNQSIIDDRANLQALIAKKNAANVEETQLTELVDRIQEFMDCGFKSDEHTRRFIRLACEKIELNEYSAHWATLTVTWAAPFHQVDVGYIYLPNGAHEAWGKADELDLRMLYPLTDRAEIVKRFPAKSWASIVKKASDLGITRDTYANGSGIKDRRVSLRDVEVMSKLGVNPRDGWQEAGAWDIAINDASEIPS